MDTTSACILAQTGPQVAARSARPMRRSICRPGAQGPRRRETSKGSQGAGRTEPPTRGRRCRRRGAGATDRRTRRGRPQS
eukprot:8373227-Alexandrium_andersonii.AAC.1